MFLGDLWPALIALMLIALVWPLSATTPTAHQRLRSLLVLVSLWMLSGVMLSFGLAPSAPVEDLVSTAPRTAILGLPVSTPGSREMLLFRFLSVGLPLLLLLGWWMRRPGRLLALVPAAPGDHPDAGAAIADRRFGPKVQSAAKPAPTAEASTLPHYRTGWHPRSTWVVLGYLLAVFIPMLMLMVSGLAVMFPTGGGNQAGVAGLPIDRSAQQVVLFASYMGWFVASLAICARYFTSPSPTTYRLVLINGAITTLALVAIAIVLNNAERPANPLVYLMLTLLLAWLQLILVALPPTTEPQGHRRRPELTVHDLDS